MHVNNKADRKMLRDMARETAMFWVNSNMIGGVEDISNAASMFKQAEKQFTIIVDEGLTIDDYETARAIFVYTFYKMVRSYVSMEQLRNSPVWKGREHGNLQNV